jgi:hypothetical protein
VLAKGKSLTKLDMRGNTLGNDGAQAMAKAFSHSHTLKSIDLGFNLVSKDIASEMEASVRTKKPECKRSPMKVTATIPELTFVDLNFMKQLHEKNKKTLSAGRTEEGGSPTKRSPKKKKKGRKGSVSKSGSPKKGRKA